MSYKLAYLKIENNKKILKVENDITKEEHLVIKEANAIFDDLFNKLIK